LFREPANAFPLYRTTRNILDNVANRGASASCCWFWDGIEHVDPMKEARAAATRIEARTTNLAIECAKLGLDWEDVLDQAAKERQRMIELGLDITDTKNILEKDTDEYESKNFEIDEDDVRADAGDDGRKRKRPFIKES
jgi:capsid protein